MTGVRIIAGRLKNRRIPVPRGVAVRPTAERAREALFGILGATVSGARVLDAYAGTGALGLEALSRGAREVVFVECDVRAVRALRDAVSRFGVGQGCTVEQAEVLERLRRRGSSDGPFDLILADPPWAASGEARSFLEMVAARGLLGRDGVLVLEADVRTPDAEVPGLVLWRRERYGRTAMAFYRAADGPPG